MRKPSKTPCSVYDSASSLAWRSLAKSVGPRVPLLHHLPAGEGGGEGADLPPMAGRLRPASPSFRLSIHRGTDADGRLVVWGRLYRAVAVALLLLCPVDFTFWV
jgi:hypothetical protein